MIRDRRPYKKREMMRRTKQGCNMKYRASEREGWGWGEDGRGDLLGDHRKADKDIDERE